MTCGLLTNNKKWGSPTSFLSYNHLKPKRLLLTGSLVAMVTYDVTIMNESPLVMIILSNDTMLLRLSDTEWYYHSVLNMEQRSIKIKLV